MNIEKSLEMQVKAEKRIPGISQLLSKRPEQFAKGSWPGYFSKAQGVEVWDLDGNKYIDMSMAGVGTNVLGYCDNDVDKAVLNAIKQGTSSTLNCPEEVELADLLCELHPWADKVRYARTGGESMAVAVRIARAFTGREKIAFCGYHGWHDWYLSANIGTKDALSGHLLSGLDHKGVPQGLQGTMFPFRYNNIEDLRGIVKDHQESLAAIVMEPIRSAFPENGFLEEVRKIATEQKAVFIFDEISSGFRINTGGAHLTFGVDPDICVFAKALGNGYPMGAIIGRGDVMDAALETFISSTYWTERIGPTAAIAMIKKHKEHDVGRHLKKVGRLVQEGWVQSAERHSLDITVAGIYPLSHFSFNYENAGSLKTIFVEQMLERGFLASTSFYAMFAHNEDHVKKYSDCVDEVFSLIAKWNSSGDIENHMQSPSALLGFKRLA